MKSLTYAGLSMLLALLALSTGPVLPETKRRSPDLRDIDDLSIW